MSFFAGVIKGLEDSVLGPDPAQAGQAYKKLQEELTSKYGQQKAAFEADPTNSGREYQMPDAIQRWGDQINSMIQSGNPILQKAGLDQLNSYQIRAAERGVGKSSPASVQEYQFAQSQGYSGSYQDWIAQKAAAGRSSVNVNVGGGNGVEGINFLSPADKERLNLPQKTAYYVNKSGEIKEAPGGADNATQQQSNVTNTAVGKSEELMFGNDGIFNTTEKAVNDLNVPEQLKRPAEAAYAFSQEYLQNDPRYAQQAAINSNLAATIGRAYLGEKGVMTDEDVSRIKKLLPDPVRDTKDTARMKMDYIKSIIKTSDPTKAKKLVYEGPGAKSEAPSKFKSKGGIEFTVE